MGKNSHFFLDFRTRMVPNGGADGEWHGIGAASWQVRRSALGLSGYSGRALYAGLPALASGILWSIAVVVYAVKTAQFGAANESQSHVLGTAVRHSSCRRSRHRGSVRGFDAEVEISGGGRSEIASGGLKSRFWNRCCDKPLPVGRPFAKRLRTGSGSHRYRYVLQLHKSRKLTLARGASAPLQLTMDLTRGHLNSGLDSPLEFAVAIKAAVIGGRTELVGWRVHGLVRSPFQVEPSRLEYGDLDHNAARELRKEVVITSIERFKEIAASCVPAYGIAHVRADSSGRRDYRWIVDVAPDSDLVPGRRDFDLVIRAVHVNGQEASFQIPCRLNVSGDYVVLPDFTHFGLMHVGQPSECTIVLQSRKHKPFDLQSVSSDTPEMKVQPITGINDSERVFRLRCTPKAAGDRVATVTFSMRLADNRQGRMSTVHHRVWYRGY
jgi:hypothetical protein